MSITKIGRASWVESDAVTAITMHEEPTPHIVISLRNSIIVVHPEEGNTLEGSVHNIIDRIEATRGFDRNVEANSPTGADRPDLDDESEPEKPHVTFSLETGERLYGSGAASSEIWQKIAAACLPGMPLDTLDRAYSAWMNSDGIPGQIGWIPDGTKLVPEDHQSDLGSTSESKIFAEAATDFLEAGRNLRNTGEVKASPVGSGYIGRTSVKTIHRVVQELTGNGVVEGSANISKFEMAVRLAERLGFQVDRNVAQPMPVKPAPISGIDTFDE
jgi:hypothetical protein